MKRNDAAVQKRPRKVSTLKGLNEFKRLFNGHNPVFCSQNCGSGPFCSTHGFIVVEVRGPAGTKSKLFVCLRVGTACAEMLF